MEPEHKIDWSERKTERVLRLEGYDYVKTNKSGDDNRKDGVEESSNDLGHNDNNGRGCHADRPLDADLAASICHLDAGYPENGGSRLLVPSPSTGES